MRKLFFFVVILLHTLANARVLVPVEEIEQTSCGISRAVIGETVAEALPESLTREARADYGKIAAATGALLTKQDVGTALLTADTALQNNWLLTGAIGGCLGVAANTEAGKKVLAEIEGATQAALEKERAVGFENLNSAEQFLVGAYHTGVIKDFAYRELDALTNGKLSLVNEWVSKGIQWTGEVASDALKSLNASETLVSHGAAFTVGAVGSLVPSKAQSLATISKTGKKLTGPIRASQHAPSRNVALEALDLNLAGEYRAVAGHHVHAKKAFEGHPNYDPKKG
ncbi:MAG: hypothetical protein ACRCUQ_01300, partial [Alphaproteobacteria bacterium]